MEGRNVHVYNPADAEEFAGEPDEIPLYLLTREQVSFNMAASRLEPFTVNWKEC